MRVVVGDEMGLVKVVDFEKRKSRKWGRQTRERAVLRMAWAGPADDAESLVACAYKTGGIELWDPDTTQRRAIFDDGFHDAVGLEVDHGESLVVASAEGGVRVLDWDTKAVAVEFATGGPLSRARCPRGDAQLIAVGGKEHDLQLWSVADQKCAWKAKNVNHDFLNMRVPVWIRDLAFVPDVAGGRSVLVTGTSYHQIRMYDTRAQRRPVRDWELNDLPITSLAPLPGGNEVVAADTLGTVSRVDLRTGRITGGFKGCGGSVRSVACHDPTGAIAAAGLDRYVRVWDCRSRRPIHRAYLKQRLTCMLVSGEGALPGLLDEASDEEEVAAAGAGDEVDTSAGIIDGAGVAAREDPNAVARREWLERMRRKKAAREAELRARVRERGAGAVAAEEDQEEEEEGGEGGAEGDAPQRRRPKGGDDGDDDDGDSGDSGEEEEGEGGGRGRGRGGRGGGARRWKGAGARGRPTKRPRR